VEVSSFENGPIFLTAANREFQKLRLVPARTKTSLLISLGRKSLSSWLARLLDKVGLAWWDLHRAAPPYVKKGHFTDVLWRKN
jgi:hypothetical protein